MMEREVEKTLLEIESAIKSNERRGNTHTQSVLEQARGIVEMCTQVARTPTDLKEILGRDKPRKVVLNAGVPICPICGRRVVKCYDFGPDCGQRLNQ